MVGNESCSVWIVEWEVKSVYESDTKFNNSIQLNCWSTGEYEGGMNDGSVKVGCWGKVGFLVSDERGWSDNRDTGDEMIVGCCCCCCCCCFWASTLARWTTWA